MYSLLVHCTSAHFYMTVATERGGAQPVCAPVPFETHCTSVHKNMPPPPLTVFFCPPLKS